MSQLQVHLYRDSFTTPWGFRLQGGKDVGHALVIQRVFANSPAEGNLQRGDIILKLNNCEAEELSHKRAQELFNSAGGQILLSIKRVQYIKKEPPKPKEIKPKTSVSASPGQKMAPTLTSKRKVGSKSSSSAKSKDTAYGGGGCDFGLDYSKVKVDANYVPGPIFNEEEAEQEDPDQAFRTVPLEFTGPGGTPVPKLGGSSIDFAVCYTKPGHLPAEPIMHRQSSKPWENQEMLYKVQDTLSHIQYPYAPPAAPGAPSNISCLNMYSTAPPPSVAPPPYIPGPPVEPETNFVDPFPACQPASMAADDEEEYEFVPVKERRHQFNKSDFTPQERRPIKPQRPPPVFAPAPPPQPPRAPKPVTPVPAPMSYSAPAPFMPAEGEVVQPAVPAWAGTLSNVGGPKLWDGSVKPGKPARSVSPQKKAAISGDFKPTQTQVLDFTTETDDGPRIMHLQYNSPLDMYSQQNVEETLQGQTQAAMGGGNTAKWLSHVQQMVTEDSQPATSFAPIEGQHFRSNASAKQQLQQAPVAIPSAIQSEPQYQPSPSKAAGATTSKLPFTPVSFRPKEIPIPKALQVLPPPVEIPILPQPQFQPPPKPIPVQPPTAFPTQPKYQTQSEQKALHSGYAPKEWAPVEAPKFNFLKSTISPTIPKPPRHVVVSEPEPVYRPWGAVTAVPPPTIKLAKQPEPEPKQVKTPDADRDRVFQELTTALQCPKTFPRGTYAAKEKMANDRSFSPYRITRMRPRVPPTAPYISYVTQPSSTPTFAHVNPPVPSPTLPVSHVSPPMQTPIFAHVNPSSVLPVAHVNLPTQTPKFGHVSPPVPVYPATASYSVAVSVFDQEADIEQEEEYVSASEPEAEYDSAPESKVETEAETISVPEPEAKSVSLPKLEAEPVSATEPKTESVSVPEPKAEPASAPETEAEPVSVPEPEAELVPVPEPISIPEPEAEPVSVPEPESEPVCVPEPESEPVSVPEPEAELVPVQKPVSAPEPEAETVSLSKVEAEPISAPETETEPVSVPEPEAESVSVPEPEVKPVPVPEPEAEPVSIPEVEPVSVPETESVSLPEPETKPVTVPESEVKPISESQPETESVSVPEPEHISAPEHEAESVSALEPEAKPISEAEPVLEPVSEHGTEAEPISVPEPEAEPISASEPESGAVQTLEPEAENVSASEVVESISMPMPEAEPILVQESEVISFPDPISVSEQKPEAETCPVSQPDSQPEPVSESLSVTELEPISIPDPELEASFVFHVEDESTLELEASEVQTSQEIAAPVADKEVVEAPPEVTPSELTSNLEESDSSRRRRRRPIAAFLPGPADEFPKASAESVEPALKQAPEVPPKTAPKPVPKPAPESKSKPVSDSAPEPVPKPVPESKSKPVSDSAPEPVPKTDPVLISKANIAEPAKRVIISKPPAAQEPKADASKKQFLKAASFPKPSEVSVAPTRPSKFVSKTSERLLPREQQKKTPAEERDWTQSALLRMIQEDENKNVPKTAPLSPIKGTPRPAVSPPKKAVAPPPQVVPKAPAAPREAVPDIPVHSSKVRPVDTGAGVSDF